MRPTLSGLFQKPEGAPNGGQIAGLELTGAAGLSMLPADRACRHIHRRIQAKKAARGPRCGA